MIVLWIFLALLAILLLAVLLILLLRVKVVISASNDTPVRIDFFIYGIHVDSIPDSREDKPKKVKLSDYTPEKLARCKAKTKIKGLTKNLTKKIKDVADSDELEGSPDVIYILKFILNLFKNFGEHYAAKFKVHILKLDITVATGDAASTAILYGGVSQAAGYLIEFLKNTTALKIPRRAKLNIGTDFCTDTTRYDVKIQVFIHLRRLISLLYRSGLRSPADFKNFFK